MAQDYFAEGEWNFICDVCNRKTKSGNARHRWDGAITCGRASCFEYRHPQDFVRGKDDPQAVPWSRPGGDDQFVEDISGVSTTVVTVPSENGVGGGNFTLGNISRSSL